ncbi:tRNA (N(6)-L-threonylcarbamoyladenosine(37)-C(2))-methylthiotransferase [Candidatus Micrarchaeota archaeon]|nr:tRNA (N(6)-L-threonylcarbamoyladenosine(37)-C(2))-methylthiotransferase [Candidatus Micrarchaeota archaeon]
MKFFLETFGCTLNQADSELIKGVMFSHGASEAQSVAKADVVIINSCTVKKATEQKILERIKKLKKKKLVVAGCMPSADKELIERFAPNACLVGPRSVGRVFEAASAVLNGDKKHFLSVEEKVCLPRFRGGVVARIPIAEGCTGACSFCQTKIARGKLSSYPESFLLREIVHSVRLGAREVQLTAQDTGAYGKDLGSSLVSLLDKVKNLKAKFRARVGMMNPEHALEFLAPFCDALNSSKFYKFAHIPVQSGSDEVLKAMLRNYCVEDFVRVVAILRSRVPLVTIATDVICGFPTETEDDFEQTMKLVEIIKPDVVNVSRFTPRKGTKAAGLKQLPDNIIKARTARMAELCRRVSVENNRQLVGRQFEVLVTERNEKHKMFTGRIPNYKQVALRGEDVHLGDFVKVKIMGITQSGLVGKIIK